MSLLFIVPSSHSHHHSIRHYHHCPSWLPTPKLDIHRSLPSALCHMNRHFSLFCNVVYSPSEPHQYFTQQQDSLNLYIQYAHFLYSISTMAGKSHQNLIAIPNNLTWQCLDPPHSPIMLNLINTISKYSYLSTLYTTASPGHFYTPGEHLPPGCLQPPCRLQVSCPLAASLWACIHGREFTPHVSPQRPLHYRPPVLIDPTPPLPPPLAPWPRLLGSRVMRAPTRKTLASKFKPVASSSKPPTLLMPIMELFASGVLSQSKGSTMNSMMIIVGSRPLMSSTSKPPLNNSRQESRTENGHE